jgi:hypothetical protein
MYYKMRLSIINNKLKYDALTTPPSNVHKEPDVVGTPAILIDTNDKTADDMNARLQERPGWTTFDSKLNMLAPWYTRNFLAELITWDISDWKVFEYGSGNSTLWWRKNVRQVHAVDTNKEWAGKVDSIYERDKDKFVQYPMNLIDDDNPAGEERRNVLGPRHDPRRPIRKLAPRCSRLEPLKKPILGNSDSGNLKIIVQL